MRVTGKQPILMLLLFLGSSSIGLLQDSTPKVTPPPGPPPIRLPLSSITPEAAIDLGGERRFAVSPEGVWVTNRAAGTLTLVDSKTNTPGKPVAVGKEPCHSPVVAFKSVWAALCGGKALARYETSVDPKAEKLGKSPLVFIATAVHGAGPIVSATESIWMITDPAGSIVRVDPGANAVVAEVTISAGATGLVAADDTLWVASSGNDLVTRVSGYSNVVGDTVQVGKAPVAIAAGAGSIWTLNGGDGTVSRIDPKTSKVVETIKTGVTGTTGAIVVGEGSVWLSAPGAPLTRIDPRTNRVVQQFSGTGGGALAIGLKSLWLTATPTTIWRLDPKRVEATVR